jgi:UDP-glucose 4-epimerase
MADAPGPQAAFGREVCLARKAIITGGAGFIGSHLAAALLEADRHVVLIDSLSTGRRENVAPLLGPRCELIVGEAGRVIHQPQVLEGADEIYHLAAAVGVRLITDDPAAMIHNNVEETVAVLNAAQLADAAVLITSSSEVYGKCPVLPLREDMDLVFGPTTASRWSYGLSKAIDEHLAIDLARRSGLKSVVVRLFNTIGPRQRGRYGMVVPRFVAWAVGNQPIQIYGDGRQTRSFCDVRDTVAAMTRLLASPACHGQVFNLGSDQPITIEELADLVIEASGSTAGKRHVPYEAIYGEGFEDPPQRQPDIAKVRDAIGFDPSIPLRQTLDELISRARLTDESDTGVSGAVTP